MTGRRRSRPAPRRSALGRRSGLSPRDLVAEALAGVLQRPARSALTGLGTVLGVGAFIAVLGLTGTAASQIDGRFNELTATEVTVKDTGGRDAAHVPLAFPPDADERIAALNGVSAAGVFWNVRLRPDQSVTTSLHGAGGAGRNDLRPQITAASQGALLATGPRLAQGRTFDAFHERERQRVAVVGSAAAARLGITGVQNSPAIFIGGTPFTVIGILKDVDRKPDLLMAVMIPRSTAEHIWGPPADDRATMLISTRLGAAGQVAGEAALALRPDHPEYFKALAPPTPRPSGPASGATSAPSSSSWPPYAWSSERWASPTPPWSP